MSKTNCSNCGGPLDIANPKCPFCGTKNINLTDIDLASGEAANFIFRLPNNIKGAEGQEVYMSMLAVPELETMSMESDEVQASGGWGNRPLVTYRMNTTLNMGLNLRAVARKDETLCNLTFK